MQRVAAISTYAVLLVTCTGNAACIADTDADDDDAKVLDDDDESGHDDGTGDDDDEPGNGWVPLVSALAWADNPAAADPFPEHRPVTVMCPGGSWFEEANSLEIETGYCNYALLSQPSPHEIRAGDTGRVLAWHNVLTAETPAQGHIALAVAGQVVWTRLVDIPSMAGVFEDTFTFESDAPAGSEISLHLHNHGYNTWNLVDFDLAPAR